MRRAAIALSVLTLLLCLAGLVPAQWVIHPKSAAVSCGTLCNDLVSYWPLDEASGTRADSVVASGNDLTDNNTVGSAAGMHNAAADLEADNSESLSITDNASLSLGADSAVTVSAWVNVESLTANHMVLGKWGGGGNTQDVEYAIYLTTGYTTFHVGNGVSKEEARTLAPLDTGNWRFLVGWHDPTADKLYLQIDNGTPVEAAWAGGTHDGDGVLAIGKAGTFASYFFDGLVDEAAIWFRVLIDDERTDLYNAGAGKFYDGSVFAYLFLDQPWRYAVNDNAPQWLFLHHKRSQPSLRMLKKAS